MTRVQEQVRTRLLTIDGVVESPGIFTDGDAFWVNGREIAHFHGDSIELRLTRRIIGAERARLKADPRIELRTGSSDWLTVRIASGDDVGVVAELAALAVDAHRPADGAPLRPPPVGPALERRRRFH